MTLMNHLSRRYAFSTLAVLLAATVHAQTPAPAPTPEPEPPKVDVTGFVDVYYGYNFNKTNPAFRTFDVQHNTFSLSLAEVAFAKGVTPESRVGFRADLDFGKTADLVGAYEPEDNGQEIYKHIQQAYVSLLTGKVTWDVGKFVTPIGAEVIESQDNWNYTRSILFGYAIPFYHTGRAGHVGRERQAVVRGLPGQRVEQQQRAERRQDLRLERSPGSPAPGSPGTSTTWGARRWRAATPGTSSTPRPAWAWVRSSP